ncbi:MAG: hypothetical protein IKO30_01840 [Lachnospiraceae bacterium]|nr:hypothetical protein [Lachnospiraceae bacterium]
MPENASSVNVEKLFSTACELPYCKIDREEFLTKELKNRVSPLQLADALENGTINAKIPINILDDIARGAIALETSKVTLISIAAGIPGGFAMIGTVPTDLAQFYAHVFRIAQKLAYIYGSKEIELSDGTQNVLMLYLGTMFGVSAANAALAKLAAANAAKIGAKVAAKPLTKYAIFNISKKILAWIGVKLTKDTFGKAITKAIPVVSGVLSGGLSVATYLPMAKKLQKELSKYAAMSPDDLAEASAAADVILADFTDMTEKLSVEKNDAVSP